ncbi:MAG TPA: flagellar basal body P-ring formation chaperone FlgA [Bryobacteraceae bacterium]|nr:flagellar basal body P-ring formation chaperone FlgA [Bryobacteraceae bacterium]
MISRIVLVLCWAARLAPALDPACIPVEGDRILGEQLAGALPAFTAVPPQTIVGSMPPPGSKRVFHAPELAALATRYSIPLDAVRDVCFEWPMQALDVERVREAMRKSLALPAADIEITETGPSLTPPGPIEFPRETLGRPANAAQSNPSLWRGYVSYGDDHRYAVWAKVRIQAPCARLVAAAALKRGQALEASLVRTEHGECFPSLEAPADAAPASLAGMLLNRPLAAGAEIRPEYLALPNDVNRGDTVKVEVNSGAAHLQFDAVAESAGRGGDVIEIRNPSSNKIFHARIQGKGRVIVMAD